MSDAANTVRSPSDMIRVLKTHHRIHQVLETHHHIHQVDHRHRGRRLGSVAGVTLADIR